MAKNDALIFLIFLSIAGISFYKWILIHIKMKNMELIKCKCTDIITRTTYHKNIYEYYYVYKYKEAKEDLKRWETMSGLSALLSTPRDYSTLRNEKKTRLMVITNDLKSILIKE